MKVLIYYHCYNGTAPQDIITTVRARVSLVIYILH